MLNNDRLLVQILLLVLFGASFWVMAPFWSALFWGAVLAFASWPLMRLLTRWLGGRESLAAGILTLGWMLLVAVPLVWLGFNLADLDIPSLEPRHHPACEPERAAGAGLAPGAGGEGRAHRPSGNRQR